MLLLTGCVPSEVKRDLRQFSGTVISRSSQEAVWVEPRKNVVTVLVLRSGNRLEADQHFAGFLEAERNDFNHRKASAVMQDHLTKLAESAIGAAATHQPLAGAVRADRPPTRTLGRHGDGRPTRPR